MGSTAHVVHSWYQCIVQREHYGLCVVPDYAHQPNMSAAQCLPKTGLPAFLPQSPMHDSHTDACPSMHGVATLCNSNCWHHNLNMYYIHRATAMLCCAGTMPQARGSHHGAHPAPYITTTDLTELPIWKKSLGYQHDFLITVNHAGIPAPCCAPNRQVLCMKMTAVLCLYNTVQAVHAQLHVCWADPHVDRPQPDTAAQSACSAPCPPHIHTHPAA